MEILNNNSISSTLPDFLTDVSDSDSEVLSGGSSARDAFLQSRQITGGSSSTTPRPDTGGATTKKSRARRKYRNSRRRTR